MRYLLLTCILLCSVMVFSQHDTSSVEDIYNKKWWLNSVTIEYFGENDTTSITTSVWDDEYIQFSGSLFVASLSYDYTSEHPNKKDKSPFRYFSYRDHEVSYAASFDLYKTKKDYKKDRIFESYDLIINDYELKLESYPMDELHNRILGEMRTYVYNIIKDTINLGTKILGTWSTIEEDDSGLEDNSDTIILRKVKSKENHKNNSCYEFKRIDGMLYCESNKIFTSYQMNVINQQRGYFPDPNYIFDSYETYVDLVQRQLRMKNRYDMWSVYDVIRVNGNEMVLKLHQE